MSITFINMVFASPKPRGAGRLCLLALADYADDDGMCFPSQPTLALKCAVSERAIRDTLGRLERSGFVNVMGHKGRCNKYQLVIDALTPEADRRGEERETPDVYHLGTPAVHSRSAPEDYRRTPRKLTADEPSDNHQKEPPTEPLRSVGSKNEVVSRIDVSTIVTRLRTAGLMDVDLAAKVESLVALHGLDLVTRQCDGLAHQHARSGKKFGIGMLIDAVKHPDKYMFVTPAPATGPTIPARPLPGTSRTTEEVAALNAAGVTSPDDWEDRGDFLRWYAPHVRLDDAAFAQPIVPKYSSSGVTSARRNQSMLEATADDAPLSMPPRA